MITKRLYGLFQRSKGGLKQNLSGSSLEARHASSPAKYHNNKNFGSPFIRDLIKDEKEIGQYYDNYLEAYGNALLYLSEKDYIHAELKLNEALANLAKVDIIPPALGKDFARIAELSELILDSSTQKKY
jgi:hypothetical protein